MGDQQSGAVARIAQRGYWREAEARVMKLLSSSEPAATPGLPGSCDSEQQERSFRFPFPPVQLTRFYTIFGTPPCLIFQVYVTCALLCHSQMALRTAA